MKRAKRPQVDGRRVWLSASVDPVTHARIDALRAAKGLSRGRLIDLAVGGITACEDCDGEGVVGRELARCEACGGHGVVPA